MVQNDEKVYGLSKERLESLFDAGTFVELGAYTKRNGTCRYTFIIGKFTENSHFFASLERDFNCSTKATTAALRY